MHFWRLLCLAMCLAGVANAQAAKLVIEKVLADGKEVSFSRETGAVLPAGRHDLEFRFRTAGETPNAWIVQYQLGGHDPTWRTVDGEMALTFRLFDGAGKEVTAQRVVVPGQNLYWQPLPKRSSLNRRIEPLLVPPGAKTLEIRFDSGSWRPELRGEWVIDDVSVNCPGEIFGGKDNFWPNYGFEAVDPSVQGELFPLQWQRIGDPAIARLERLFPGTKEANNVLTLRDFSGTAYGAWFARQPLPAKVKAGDVLTIGWFERSRVGDQRAHTAVYADVPPGRMLFRAVGRGAGAVFEQRLDLPVVIRPYIWTEPWFTPVAALLGAVVLSTGGWQWMRRRFRSKLAQAELEARVERDRLRIARDIHDDVGASLTQIALSSRLARLSPALEAADHVEEIETTARRTVTALDEIVWMVNPRNDTLAVTLEHLGQYTVDFLSAAGIACELELPSEIPPVPLPTQARQHLSMVVKEALHNIVKHAQAGAVQFKAEVGPERLLLTIADNGAGFAATSRRAGSDGLLNMESRLAELGGHCRVESILGVGTQVVFEVPLPK